MIRKGTFLGNICFYGAVEGGNVFMNFTNMVPGGCAPGGSVAKDQGYASDLASWISGSNRPFASCGAGGRAEKREK